MNWEAFAGAGANDFVQLTVREDSGYIVFDSGFPGQPSALPGSARLVTIPSGTLTAASIYNAALTFGHITSRDSTAIPGGLGVTTYASQTRFLLITTGAGTESPSRSCC